MKLLKNAKVLLAISLLLSGCVSRRIKPRIAYLQPISFNRLVGWQEDNHLAALETFKTSCKVILKYQPHRRISRLTSLGGHASDWIPPCAEATQGAVFSDLQAKNFFEKWFRPYRITDNAGKDHGKFTGYYELELKGSKRPSKLYKHPVYKTPSNIKHLKGSHKLSHAAINRGSLKNKKLEIAWVSDRSRLFFMHIQGSGVVQLHDGTDLKLGYAEQNGYPYTTIGPIFKHCTKDRIRSALDMMKWLESHPKEGQQIMERNQSYIFFKEITGPSPIGAQGVALTPERSIAIDSGLYPYGAPIWLQTTTPNSSNHHKSHAYNRLMIAQDTGGAIKGAIRGDIFYGRGQSAEQKAGFMNKNGAFFVLFPKTVSVPKKYTNLG
jgi:membrane-bound lytic murein transglycosylase A